jgi:hypothetical protein
MPCTIVVALLWPVGPGASGPLPCLKKVCHRARRWKVVRYMASARNLEPAVGVLYQQTSSPNSCSWLQDVVPTGPSLLFGISFSRRGAELSLSLRNLRPTGRSRWISPCRIILLQQVPCASSDSVSGSAWAKTALELSRLRRNTNRNDSEPQLLLPDHLYQQ